MATTIELDDWELGEMRIRAAQNVLAYLGHYHGAGLKRNEVETLNRWKQLSDKLGGKPASEPYEYRGTRGNNWNKNSD